MENKAFELGEAVSNELYSFGDLPVSALIHSDVEQVDEDVVEHSGIKGMKWGVRRFQNKDGSLTPAGKKRYNREMEKVKAETRKIKNQQRTAKKLSKLEDAKKNLEKLKKDEKEAAEKLKKGEKEMTPEDIEAKKKQVLESRSAKQLYDNANLFTTNELNAAKLRLELERSIKQLEPPTVDKGKEFAKKFTDTANTISDVAQSGSKAYNNVAKIYNAFIGKKNGQSLPIISDSVTSKLDKFKEETEWIKAKNERKKAEDDAKPKVKSDLDKLREETARIDAENKNREAKRASRAHDEKDAKEAARQQQNRSETKKDSNGNGSAETANGLGSGSASNKSEDNTVYTGKVTGEGTSRRKEKVDTVIDAEWTEMTVSNVPATQTSRGKSYIDNILSLPAPREDD